MPQFDFANNFWISQIFWLVVIFLSLYILVAFFIVPRIKNIHKLRNRKVSHLLNQAQEIRKRAEDLQSIALKRLTEVKQTAETFFSTKKKESDTELDRKWVIEKKLIMTDHEVSMKKIDGDRILLEAALEQNSQELSKVIIKKFAK